MLNIRFGAFETNSSSVHTLVMCTGDEYKKLQDGKLYIYDEKIITKEDAITLFLTWNHRDAEYTASGLMELSDIDLNNLLADWDIYSLDKYEDRREYLERYVENYITPGGEEVVAFGYYGDDY